MNWNTMDNNAPESSCYGAEIIAAAENVLSQGEAMLLGLSDLDYSRKLEIAFNASIGSHFRHCLDHFKNLFQALGSNQVNYEDRKRDARIETDRQFALSVTRELRRSLQDLPMAALAQPLATHCKVNYLVDNPQIANSSFGREIMYSVAHAIHHYALISVMARSMQVKLPASFGVAPSTLQHQQALAQVASR